MKTLIALFFFTTASFAQTALIAANSMSFSMVVNGTTVTITGPTKAITVPVTLPAASSGLPAGVTYSPTTGLTVNGPVTASGIVTGSELAVTGGSSVPTCSSGLYLLQYTASTNTLTPACYTPTSIPAITVSQAANGVIMLTQ